MTTGPDDSTVPDETDAGGPTASNEPPADGSAPEAAPPLEEPAAWPQPEQAGTTAGEVPPPFVSPSPQQGVRYDVPQDQKNLAMLSTIGMLIAGFISPLVVFAVTNGDPAKRFANDHAKEGLNFAITAAIAGAVTALLALLIIGFLLIPLLIGWSLWVIIAGTIQASNGEAPHYPLVPKILK